MENTINADTIFIPTAVEHSDNGNYFVIVPKNNNIEDRNKQTTTTTTTAQNPLLLPKPEIFHYLSSNQAPQQHQQQQHLMQHLQQRLPNRNNNRDDKRRANHNEIERRRRDKISTWISELGTLLPVPFRNKNESKGETLTKVCEYITELQSQKKKLAQKNSEFTAVKEMLQELEGEVNDGLEENGYLKDELLKCGFQLEQVTVPEGATNHQETTYLELGNNQNGGGADDDSGAIHNDIDTYFQA